MHRSFLLTVFCVLTEAACFGQYTYFSNFYPSPYPDVGSGVGAHLLTVGDSIVALGIYPQPFESSWIVEKRFYIIDQNGNTIDEVFSANSNNAQMTLNYAGSISSDSQGNYLLGCSWVDTTLVKATGRIVKWSASFADIGYLQVEGFEADSILLSELFVGRELQNQQLVGAGIAVYDLDPGPGQDYSSFVLVKWEETGELVWQKEVHFYLEQIVSNNRLFMRLCDLFEMPNGDFLIWGAQYHDWNPIVLRFDSGGNFLSHSTWGHDWLDDWLPFPVRTGEEEFVFGYTSAQYYNNQSNILFTKPRAGKFNSSTMQVELWQPFEYEMRSHFVTDTELIGDSAVAMLGFGVVQPFSMPNDEADYEIVYMIKSDLQGNLIWYHEYLPPLPFLNPDAWDLEVTPDGGLAFVGNFRHLISQNEPAPKYTWVVKTDACGDVVFNGCPPPVGVAENAKPAGLMLYPNPANNQLNIILPPGVNRAEVYSLSGQLVMSQFIYPGWDRAAIDVSGLAGGMYMVRVVRESGEMMGVGRFVRE